MSEDIELDYEFLMQQALRYLMRDVLQMVAQIGDAPGKHHFYIEFDTGADGVLIPEDLRESYPERMTIVLQHQFENLNVDEDGFAVTLWFKGKEARLRVPFAAVRSFADPSVEFGLRFESGASMTPDEAKTADDATTSEEAPETPAPAPKKDADIVNLDAFRKK